MATEKLLLSLSIQLAPKLGMKNILLSLSTVPGANPKAGFPDGAPVTVYSRLGLNMLTPN